MHQRLVSRGVAVRVVFAEDLADEAGALGKALGVRVADGIQDASLHRLQPIGDLGQRARLDGRDRVAEVGLRGVLLDRRGVVAVVGCKEVQRLGVFGHLNRSSCLWALSTANSTAALAFSNSSVKPALPAASQWYLPLGSMLCAMSRVTLPSLFFPSQ